jgi:hypothetical protein
MDTRTLSQLLLRILQAYPQALAAYYDDPLEPDTIHLHLTLHGLPRSPEYRALKPHQRLLRLTSPWTGH